MQAGSREGGLALAVAFLGIDSGYGVQGALLYRVRDFICIVVGIALIMFDKKKKNIKLNDIVEGNIPNGTVPPDEPPAENNAIE